jgi:hypothetical protein
MLPDERVDPEPEAPANPWLPWLGQVPDRALDLARRLGRRLGWRLQGFLWELRHAFSVRGVFSILSYAFLLALLLAGIRVAPVLYGRAALVHAARIAAQQSALKGTDRVTLELRHRAFELGFPEAALEPDVFRVDPRLNEDGPACEVAYDFVHTVSFYGAFRLPIRIQARVERPQVEALPSPLGEEKEPGGRYQ